MTAQKVLQWPSESILIWLEQILSERFGVSFVLEAHGCEFVRVFCQDEEGYVQIVCNSSAFSGAVSEIPCAYYNCASDNLDSALNTAIPAPGITELPAHLVCKVNGNHFICYDILGFIYWMLSRSEEVGCAELDKFGRFPAVASHAYRYGYLERPIVDEWMHVLRQVFQRQWPGITTKKPQYTMKVSHDVDEPSRYGFRTIKALVRVVGASIVRRRDFYAPFKAVVVKLGSRYKLSKTDPSNTFDWIMGVSEEYGLKSAFYFICGRTDNKLDADYELEHPAIRELLREMHDRGHEVGLHPSFNSYAMPGAIASEYKRLRSVCAEEGISQAEWGGRMHYLRWTHPGTMREWEQAGLDYDSTLGYAELPGFRCGTCHEYPAFDPVLGVSYKLRVRPLVAMECSVTATRYMGLGCGQSAQEKFFQLIDASRAVGGCFTLLWHNSNFTDSAERDLYKKVVAYGSVSS